MRTRTLLIALVTATFLTTAASGAFARPDGGKFHDLTPEKQQAVTKIMKDSDTRLIPLQEKMHAKRLELNALSGNPNVKPEALSALAGEIAALGTQIRKEVTDRKDKIAAETGMTMGMGGMMGGMGSMDGHGKDHDMHGGKKGGMGMGMGGMGGMMGGCMACPMN